MPEMKFETAMERLEKIVQGLEGGDVSLEKALKDFEEGMKLVTFCSKKLEQADKKVSMLVEESGGTHTQVPFEAEQDTEEE